MIEPGDLTLPEDAKRRAQQDDLVTQEQLAAMVAEANQTQTTYNLAICCVVLFCAEASRGLFIPSLWSCVQHIGMDHSFLSWCIPLFSVGRMAGSFLAGSASDRWGDDGVPTIACLLASVLGGAIYVAADMQRSWMLLLAAEFAMGLGGGTLAVLRAHVSKITTDKLRISHTTYISTAQFAGLGLMPLAALAINTYFVGPHHHAEHAAARAAEGALLAASAGLIADATVQWTTSGAAVSHAPTDPIATQQFKQHYRTPRRSYHAGLENSNRAGRPSTMVHAAKQPMGGAPVSGGRHLLSTGVTTAAALIAPLAGEIAEEVEVETFFQSLLNHRTAPALLIILLNLVCLLLYFLYFDAHHESTEYTQKKRQEAAKKRIADQQATGAFDVDNDAGGNTGAFAKDPAAQQEQPQLDAQGKKKKKELIFDVSKLDALSFGAASPAEADGADAASPAAASSSDVSIVQVRDTTVITLQSFADEAASPTTPAQAVGASRKKNRGGSSADEDDADDLEMDRRGAASAATRANAAKPGIATTISNTFASVSSVVSAIVQLFQTTTPKDAANKGSVNAPAGAGGPVLASTSSQSARIASYESGRARVDLDDEGVYLGPLLLTPERMVLWGSCLFVYLNYTIRGVLATVETVGTPTLAKFQGIPPGPLEVAASAKFFGVLGLLGCVVFFFQWYFQDYIDEPTTLIAGFTVTVVGSTAILLWKDSEMGFIFGCVCIWSFGLPAVQNSVLSALSRILGTRPQGTWMGWIQTFGSLGRVTFPMITKIFSVPFAFFLSSLGCGIAIIALLIYMKLVRMTM